jgi:UDP-glucose 4-epimerase
LIVNKILVTGAGGYLGSQLVPVLAERHDVIALSRQPANGQGRRVQGDFADRATLDTIADQNIGAVVHLAAAVGGSSEEDAMTVNVVGTRRLMRWAIDNGVRRFLLASSISATGCNSPAFLPREVPVPDDYPSEAVDAYGLSKAIVEDLGAYFSRQLPALDITAVRIGTVLREDELPVTEADVRTTPVAFATLGTIAVSDAIRALAIMTERPTGPGFRRVNLVGGRIRSTMPVPETIRLVYGDRAARLDFSHYEKPGHESDSLYATSRMAELFGFRPVIDPATLREVETL